MTERHSSSDRVPYDLRPRKQIERRMMVHALQKFAEAGLPISRYRYAGFGGFFFIDFIIFRRLLAIRDMVSIEHDYRYPKRVRFNKPFADIDIRLEPAADFISQIDRQKRHILWLDYDGPIHREQLEDLNVSASLLAPGSLLIATFDVDFDRADEIRDLAPTDRQLGWRRRFERETGVYYHPAWTTQDFAASAVARRSIDVASAAIESGVNMRPDITYDNVFSFLYADGHEMLTIGGIVSSGRERTLMDKVDWTALRFIRRDLAGEPFRIDIPVLTRKERLHIDSNLPAGAKWAPEFELDSGELAKYTSVYEYCPLYAELLL
jgi:hypothetical protein